MAILSQGFYSFSMMCSPPIPSTTTGALLLSVSTVLRRCFSSDRKLPSLSHIPSRYRHRALEQAKHALTEYLHATRSIPFTYAHRIIHNSRCSVSQLVSQLKFSAPAFPRTVRKFLRYHPINEFDFFFESIGIDYLEISTCSNRNNLFLAEDQGLFDTACALSAFGFPWNKLGVLYKGDASVFSKPSAFVSARLERFKTAGFGTQAVVGTCLAFPSLLTGEEGESAPLLASLKKLFVDNDLKSSVEDSVDAWLDIGRKIRLFYVLDVDKRKLEELIALSKTIFLDYPEGVLVKRMGFFCDLGVSKEDVALLVLKRPELLCIQPETTTISLLGFLKHFGIREETLVQLKEQYPYVFGRNKMIHLPLILKAMHLDKWFSDKIYCGDGHLLSNYALCSPDEDEDENYLKSLEKIGCLKTHVHEINKLKYLHSVGFGENSHTMKMLADIHGSSSEIEDRFNFLLEAGIEFSKLCKILSKSPKVINQDVSILRQKIDFLFQEVGLSLEYLDSFPGILCFGLENRIKPRYKFIMILQEKGWCKQNINPATLIATSEKKFVARLATYHPTATKLWFEYQDCKNLANRINEA